MHKVAAIAERVLRQLLRDFRFLVLSLLAPLVVIYITKAALDSFDVPFVNISNFVIPIGAFIVHFATYVLCAVALVRERTAQTLARMFVNGYNRAAIIEGYMLAYTALATVQAFLVMVELKYLFHLTYPAPMLLSLYLVLWMLAVISISLGIFVSNFARTEAQVMPFIPLVTVPGIFLSDVIFSVDRFPRWMQALSHATPLFYANKIIQNLVRESGTLGGNWQRLALLLVYGVIVLVLATETLRETD